MNGLQSKHAVIVVCSALLMGVLFRNIFSVSSGVIITLFLTSLLLLLLSFYYKKGLAYVLGFVFIVVGFGWTSYVATDMCQGFMDSFVGKEMRITGVVRSEPTSSGVKQSFNLSPKETGVLIRGEKVILENIINTAEEKRCLTHQKFLVSVDTYPEVFYGDLVEVSTKLQKPSNFETEFDREFDYVSYLGKDDVYYTLPFGSAEIIESRYQGAVRRFLFKIKKSFLRNIEKLVPEPESTLLGGVLLGEKQSLSDDLKDDFVATGLIHIVVLSGYNVSLVAEAVTYILGFLPRVIAYSASSFGILLFMVLTGANPPIVRASIMAILILVARVLGRPTEAGRLLLIVATIMVLINPSILLFDVSFHLSFLATLGLIYMFPIVDGFISRKIPELYGIRKIASATLSTQIVVLPYLLWKIGAFSLISPITNIIVLPFIPIAMLLGFFTGLAGYIFLPLASLFSYATYLVLKIVIVIVEWFAGLPFAIVSIPKIPFLVVLVIYLGLGYYVFIKKHYE